MTDFARNETLNQVVCKIFRNCKKITCYFIGAME
jgi:hypothetical protein